MQMTFCIISHVLHTEKDGKFIAYSPYVNEMNIWLKYVEKVIVVAPLKVEEVNPIQSIYSHNNIAFIEVPHFSITNFRNGIVTMLILPKICFSIFKAMQKADHIHLRCPGNMGLLGSCIQIFFPSKKKTTKYAGNWDPQSKQPISYRIQKWIVSNPFLTKNMQVLVYGEWEKQSKNIKPFFTATYRESEKEAVTTKNLNGLIKFIFVGTFSIGKQPLYAIQLIQKLKENGHKVQLALYGEGVENEQLVKYIQNKNCGDYISLNRFISKDDLKKVYQESHFLVLPSKSEGWPKVVAEAMFWGCVPLATNISCISNMLDNESRGLFLSIDIESDSEKIQQLFQNESEYQTKINNAIHWSRNFTIDKFEDEIKQLLKA